MWSIRVGQSFKTWDKVWADAYGFLYINKSTLYGALKEFPFKGTLSRDSRPLFTKQLYWAPYGTQNRQRGHAKFELCKEYSCENEKVREIFLARSLGALTKCFFLSNNRGRNFRDTLPLKMNFIKFSDLLASCYPDHVLGMFKYCQELFKDQPPAALLFF